MRASLEASLASCAPAPLDGQVVLGDGRRLHYSEHGDGGGFPLILFQGTPTSRLPHNPLGTSAHARIIVPERPGFGRSDDLPGRTLLGWAADVRELADQLGIERFSVAGVSGGAPHALACGVVLAHRIRRIGIVAGIGPVDAAAALRTMAPWRAAGVLVARHAPRLLRALLWLLWNPSRDGGAFVRRAASGLSERDLRLLEDPAFLQLRARSYEEATRQGLRGLARELTLLARPWGFELGDVGCDVLLWHGERDRSAPVAMARHVERSLPRCRATYLEEEGHFLAAGHWDEIVRALIAPGIEGPSA